MNQPSSSPSAKRIARTILNGFDAYFADYQNITLGAKARFETANWARAQSAHRDRIELYKTKADQVRQLVGTVTSKNVLDLSLWQQARQAYAQLVSNHNNYEIAETFFNSIFCNLFDHQQIHDSNLFVKPSKATDNKQLENYSIYFSYPLDAGTQTIIERLFEEFAFSTPWEDMARDVARIDQTLNQHLTEAGLDPVHGRIDVLESIFYRNKGAYLVGRLVFDNLICPFVIAFQNNERNGIFADALLLDQDSVSRIFSFTRSYFMVDTPVPSRFVRFLRTLMPRKDVSEIYNALGFNKHGKTEFYRHTINHMKASDDLFVEAPGIRGMVMSVFTLPSYDVVFKVIKDRFDPPKTVTEAIVKEKYKLVSRSDRAGRMADTQEYSNFIFYRNRFSEELLAELQRVAPSKLIITSKTVIIKHLYTERRMTPLNLYLAEANENQLADVMNEYGLAIKQLAAANIFTGDMLLKNFGVTRHGRVVFYDYDEICLITECNFRKIPEPRNEQEEMADRPWYPVAENDIFPEEFRLFFTGAPQARAAFERYHQDLYDYRYWQKIQTELLDGKINDTFPYRQEQRFKRT
ncbi:bifunctional isocitrate dehydrogenase kinase/phosphatase [Simiduia agarivorans]|uniref:Isocitrate dehydrogenase kinase/phosphatase n=1 Tax=Simiduia agarivorans (strain DSM 21679 / JCM 13881 / BCRC 17597 / SA1) TaxID=1117647 RepID=K4KM92_SIMAS|nr:bifunctional isocitrate dehydrogenase kinase/phosphatase [Simiduia agarivorans]AFU99350.1 bifunctional isocitrate dehydrogenase kinase/phosphatase protein [Simiduia agarivorans SA1 = DSM 21679]